MGNLNENISLKLSHREKECLIWASKDKTVKETSVLMNVTPETIKTYRSHALRKIGCKTITGAVGLVLQNIHPQ